MNRFFLSSILALILPWIAPAQDQDPIPAPAPPFLAPIPDNTACTIKVTNELSGDKLPPGARIVKQMINIKSGSARVLISDWTDGSRSQTWFVNGCRLEQAPGNGPITVTRLNGNADPQNADFPGFEWLSLSNYKGLEKKNSINCYKFKDQLKLTGQRVTVDYLAYIDVKTKMPVSWDVGANHFNLASMEAAAMPAIPQAFSESLKAYRIAESIPRSYKKKTGL
ncbi:MAG: hypothetical protein WCH43_05410 [Verrucomicrobiota bacterium]